MNVAPNENSRQLLRALFSKVVPWSKELKSQKKYILGIKVVPPVKFC